MIFESTPHFFNCHMWMFPFWKHLIAFFRNKRWKVIGFTEGSIFSNVAHTYFYRSFVVFKQRTTFFFLLSKLIILQKQRFSFLWKNRNIVLFVNSLQKRKAQESINKVSVELLIEQNQHGVNVKVVLKGFQITSSKWQKKEIKKTNKQKPRTKTKKQNYRKNTKKNAKRRKKTKQKKAKIRKRLNKILR